MKIVRLKTRSERGVGLCLRLTDVKIVVGPSKRSLVTVSILSLSSDKGGALSHIDGMATSPSVLKR